MRQINECSDAKILRAECDHFLILRENAHDLLRQQCRDQRKYRSSGQNQLQNEIKYVSDGFQILRAVILAGKDESRRADAHTEEGKDVIKLICKAGRGDRAFTKLSHHDGIHHVYALIDDALQDDGQDQKKGPPVKALLRYDKASQPQPRLLFQNAATSKITTDSGASV